VSTFTLWLLFRLLILIILNTSKLTCCSSHTFSFMFISFRLFRFWLNALLRLSLKIFINLLAIMNGLIWWFLMFI
jgi:hypothetical protein